MAVVLMLVVGSAVIAAAPASASPTSCYHGWRQSAIATHYYAWGKCYAGSGYYQVAATCYVYPSTYVVRGPWVGRTSTSGSPAWPALRV